MWKPFLTRNNFHEKKSVCLEYASLRAVQATPRACGPRSTYGNHLETTSARSLHVLPLFLPVIQFVRSGLREGSSPRDVCETLLDACLSPDPRGTRYAGCDNMTVVLVLLDGWESALASKAYTPASTFSGGRMRGIAEAEAALSATLPKMPRNSNNVRPPLPPEFRKAQSASQRVSQNVPTPTRGSQGSTAGGRVGGETTAPVATTASTESPDGGTKDAALAATADAGAVGWPQQRIAAGKVAPPRTAHGIEFALARFTAPEIPIGARAVNSRASTGGLQRASSGSAGGGAAGGARAGGRSRSASHGISLSHVRRRNSAHLRSATAPMLPSPLIHQRRGPSEERLTTAAAIAVLGEVGAAGAVAVAAAAAENEAPPPPTTYRQNPAGSIASSREQVGPGAEVNTSVAEEGGVGKGAGDAGLVFVPAPEGMTPVEVTVTAAASPLSSRATRSE